MMEASLWAMNCSPRIIHERPYVNRLAVLLSIVLEVTDVRCRLTLKVSCAKNHSGATYMTHTL